MLDEMLIYEECRLLPYIWVLVVPMQKVRVLEIVATCRQIGAVVTLIVYHFASCVVEHMVGCFATFRSFVFLLKLSRHFVAFAVFCEMTCVFATHGTIRCPLVSTPSSTIASIVGALSPTPATRSLIKASILLVWRWPRETLLC